jgi:hypothetical protein
MSENNQQSLPFFARYLEGQFCEDLSVEEMDEVQGGLTPDIRAKFIRTIGLTPDIKVKSPDELLINSSFIKDNSINVYRGMTNKAPSDGDDDITFFTEIYPPFNHP